MMDEDGTTYTYSFLRSICIVCLSGICMPFCLYCIFWIKIEYTIHTVCSSHRKLQVLYRSTVCSMKDAEHFIRTTTMVPEELMNYVQVRTALQYYNPALILTNTL